MPFLKKVVVGEDEDAIAHLIQATLGDAGWLCLRGRDGEATLALTIQESPDLLILDVLMPKLDGIETVKRLKADPVHSKVPVLMLTSLASVDDRVRGLDAGADDYLAKPFDLRELRARAAALVRLSRRERDRSPTTDLPGPNAFDEGIEARLAAGTPFALVFVEIEGFDPATDAAGWAHPAQPGAQSAAEQWTRGEALVRELGRGLHAACAPAADVLLAHLGGDDFAALAPAARAPGLADALAAAADARLAASGLRAAVTVVDAAGARTTAELAHKVAQARKRRG